MNSYQQLLIDTAEKLADRITKRLEDEIGRSVNKNLIVEAVKYAILDNKKELRNKEVREAISDFLGHREFIILGGIVDGNDDTIIYIYDKKENRIRALFWFDFGDIYEANLELALFWTVANYLI